MPPSSHFPKVTKGKGNKLAGIKKAAEAAFYYRRDL